MQRNHEVTFKTGDGGFRGVYPLHHHIAGIGVADDFFAAGDFVAIGVVEVGCGSLPAVFIELKSKLFVPAGFGFQIGIADEVAAS